MGSRQYRSVLGEKKRVEENRKEQPDLTVLSINGIFLSI